MARSRNKFWEDVYFGILHLTQMSTERPQLKPADDLVIGDGGVRSAISALVSSGLARLLRASSSEDRRRYAYVLTSKGATDKAALTRRLLGRRIKAYDAFGTENETLRDELGGETTVRSHRPD